MTKLLRLSVVTATSLALGALGATPAMADDEPTPPCKGVMAADKYVATTDYGREHKPVAAPQGNRNNTNRWGRATFVSKKSGTITTNWTPVDISVNADVVVGGAEVKTHLDLSYAATAEIGNSIDVDVPPYKTVRANWGVFTRKTGGTYHKVSGCHEYTRPITAWTPHYVGWNWWYE